MGRSLVLGVAVALLTPLHLAAAGNQRSDYWTRILASPSSGDELSFRTTFHNDAQDLSNRIFNPLAKVLGGQAPTLNFVDSVDGGFHASADPASNSINYDPAATEGLIDENGATHSGAVNGLPHEMAHLRQTPAVLASLADREGGAQAFADLVSPEAAALARTYYDDSRNYDGSYAAFVKAAQGRGNDWLLGGQFGHPPVVWP